MEYKMKSRILLLLLAPVFAFFIGCGPVDNFSDNTAVQDDSSVKAVDNTVSNGDSLNLSEQNKNDWWLAYYIPSAYHFYMNNPHRFGVYYPYRNLGCNYSLTNPSAPFYPWANYAIGY